MAELTPHDRPPPAELHDWKPLVEDLADRRERALGHGRARAGRPPAVDRQAAGPRAARRCCSTPGTFVEFGQLADSMDPGLASTRATWPPTDGGRRSARSTAGGSR